jgi:hypothetical protein
MKFDKSERMMLRNHIHELWPDARPLSESELEQWGNALGPFGLRIAKEGLDKAKRQYDYPSRPPISRVRAYCLELRREAVQSSLDEEFIRKHAAGGERRPPHEWRQMAERGEIELTDKEWEMLKKLPKSSSGLVEEVDTQIDEDKIKAAQERIERRRQQNQTHGKDYL